MSELLDKLVMAEAEALAALLDEDDPPAPSDDREARAQALAVHALNQEEAKIKDTLAGIMDNYRAHLALIDKRRLALKGNLLEHVKQHGRLVLPDVGTFGTRKVPGGLRLVDEAAAEAWALANGKATKPVLDKAAYRELAEGTTQENGQLLPGTVRVPDGTTLVASWHK